MSVYLMIDLASVTIPFLFSFHPKIAFYKQWKYAFPALILAAIPYLIWDQWFTQTGVWGFTPAYHGSIMIGDMPLEEVLFFLCIPYSCLFTYWSIQQLTSIRLPERAIGPLYAVLFAVFFVMMIIGYDQWYTLIDGAFAAVILAATYIVRRDLLRRFFPVYLLVLVPFFINQVKPRWWIQVPQLVDDKV